MPDEQFAELRAAHAKATPGKLRSVGFRLSHEANRNIDSTVFHLDEIGQIGSGPYQAIPFARREDAEWHAAVHNSFQELIAALDQARAERDAYHAALSEIYYRAIPMNEDSGHSTIAHIAADAVRGNTSNPLYARDARMKREGAAEWLENAAREGGYYERSSDGMLEEAAELRKGGE